MANRNRLEKTLGHPDLSWFVERVRRTLEQGRPLPRTVTLKRPTPAQRSAVARFFGRVPTKSGTVSIRSVEVDSLLRHAGLSDGLVEAIEILSGPIVDRRARKAEIDDRWNRVFRQAEEQAGSQRGVQDWVSDLRCSGLLARLSSGDPAHGEGLIRNAHSIVRRLPAGGIPLSELAASATGDSHALDPGQPLATLVLRFAGAAGGLREWNDSESRRDAWTAVGVFSDELSAPVLVLNLRCNPSSDSGRALNLHVASGEPYRITTRQLLRNVFGFAPSTTGRRVFACENPAVVAAAAHRLGRDSRPLFSIEGQPKTAARLLIRALRASDIEVAYHGDFDWSGIQIGNIMIQSNGAVPWRFQASDYLEQTTGKPLRGKPVAACWDPDLEPAMKERGFGVDEEQLFHGLLHDLNGSGVP